MFLMVKDKQLLKNYNKIWEKFKSLMRKKLKANPFMVMMIIVNT